MRAPAALLAAAGLAAANTSIVSGTCLAIQRRCESRFSGTELQHGKAERVAGPLRSIVLPLLHEQIRTVALQVPKLGLSKL